MGVYQLQNGSFNGHPYYEHMDELNSIETVLYYEKKGEFKTDFFLYMISDGLGTRIPGFGLWK